MLCVLSGQTVLRGCGDLGLSFAIFLRFFLHLCSCLLFSLHFYSLTLSSAICLGTQKSLCACCVHVLCACAGSRRHVADDNMDKQADSERWLNTETPPVALVWMPAFFFLIFFLLCHLAKILWSMNQHCRMCSFPTSRVALLVLSYSMVKTNSPSFPLCWLLWHLSMFVCMSNCKACKNQHSVYVHFTRILWLCKFPLFVLLLREA